MRIKMCWVSGEECHSNSVASLRWTLGFSYRLRAGYTFNFRKSFMSNRFLVIHFRGINDLNFVVNQRLFCSHMANASVVVPALAIFGTVATVGNSVVVFVCAFSARAHVDLPQLLLEFSFLISFRSGSALCLFFSPIILGSLTGSRVVRQISPFLRKERLFVWIIGIFII